MTNKNNNNKARLPYIIPHHLLDIIAPVKDKNITQQEREEINQILKQERRQAFRLGYSFKI